MTRQTKLTALALALGTVLWGLTAWADQSPNRYHPFGSQPGTPERQSYIMQRPHNPPDGSGFWGPQDESQASDQLPALLHGGVVMNTRQHVFETVLTDEGVRLYLYDAARRPLGVAGVKGQVRLEFPDGKARLVELTPRYPDEAIPEQEFLFGPVDLAGVLPGTLRAAVELRHLKGPENEIDFAESVTAIDKPQADSWVRKEPVPAH